MNNLKVGIVFDVKSGKFKTEMKQNTQQVNAFALTTQQTTTQVNTFNRAIDRSNKTLVTTSKVATSVRNSIAGVAAGFGAFNIGQGLTQELAAFQDIRTRLQGLSVDAADYADKERWLIALAAEHHKELTGLADGYSRLSALTKENIITDAAARNMLEGLSNAASRNGASSADLERVYYGLSQAVGAGTVNMEDFRQVTEPLPDLMAKIARVAGFETSKGLKDLIGSGQLTSRVFSDLLVKALADYDGAAASTADNINTKYRDIKREYQLLAKELEQPINGALLPTLDGLAEGLNFLSENVDGVIDVLQVGLVVAAGHATNAIIAKTTSISKEIVSSRASAIAAKNKATSEYNLALAYKASAVGSVQAHIADQRLIASKNTLTAATNKTNIALRASSGAMALLGGPVGVAILAAYAIGSYALSAADAAIESENLANKVGLADKKLSELTNKQLRLRLFELENDPAAEIDKARLRTLKAQEEYNKVQASRGFSNPNNETEKDVLNRDVEIEALEAKFTKAKELQEKIKSILAKPSTQPNESSPSVVVPTQAELDKDKDVKQGFAALETSLLSQEQRIHASYQKRQTLLDDALAREYVSKERAAQLSAQLEQERDTALTELKENAAARDIERINQKRQLEDQLRRDAWNTELAELQGFHSLREAEEAAHNERVMQVKARKTGELQGNIVQFANFEKKTTLEKTSAVIGLGEKGFQAMASQSKKAFALSKAFSIGQALIKTYESATGAYAALAPIPIVGPALGAAAALAAVAFGVAQVNTIRAQQPPGFESGGNIGNNNIIEFGERNKPEVLEFEGRNYLLGGNGGAVFNRSQLQEINNSNSQQQVVGGDITLNYAPVMQQAAGQDFGTQLTDHADKIIEIMRTYKNDNGEAF